MLILHQVLFQVSREKYFTGIFLIGFLLEKGNQGKRSCSLPLENLPIFSPLSPRAESVASGVSLSADSDQGLALNLASIFEKIAGAKNSIDAITCGFHDDTAPSLVSGIS